MWKCAKCGESIDDSFDVCWACGTGSDGVETPGFFDEAAAPGLRQQGQDSIVEGLPDIRSSENLVTVARCSLPVEAYAIRLRLESAGIPVVLADEFTVTMDWLLSNAIGGVKVQVREDDLRQANQVLAEIERPERADDHDSLPDDDDDGSFFRKD